MIDQTLQKRHTARYRIIIADDHPLVLDSLHNLLGYLGWFEQIQLASDGVMLCDLARQQLFDAAIVDLSMPRLDGLSSIRRLRRIHPQIALVAFTGSELWYPAPEVKEAGADEYLSKSSDGEELVAALARALQRRGREVPAFDALTHSIEPEPALTAREREVLKLLAEGYSLEQSGQLLHISGATVRKHRENIYQKLGSSNTAELTLTAIRMGLLSGGSG